MALIRDDSVITWAHVVACRGALEIGDGPEERTPTSYVRDLFESNIKIAGCGLVCEPMIK